jgi:amino acid adenylation domain-containing protein
MTARLLQNVLLQAASQFPGHIAVECSGETITYAHLDQRSAEWSQRLIRAGCRPGQIVAVWLPKSIESIVSFFGVLKAGCAYIPLDPDYCPESRALKIITQSNASAIISKTDLFTDEFKNGLAVHPAKMVLFVDDQTTRDVGGAFSEKTSARHNNGTPADAPLNTEDGLAYILYTSGSTGAPKGVMITHRNALSFIGWALDRFKPSHNDVFANHAPFHFDLSVFDVFVSLATGACVHLIPFAVAGNPRLLVRWAKEHKITIWYSVPSVWLSIFIFARIDANDFKTLRLVLFAGEVFPKKYLEKLMQALPWADYYNLYGPTETNVCTWYHVTSKDLRKRKSVPIGTACDHAEAIALDADLTEVATGSKGMLYIKGPTVTPGYYNDPAATRAAFIVSPLPRHDGCVLYRTGDIVKVIGHDLYEYIGRDDLMVKCAGYRIELSEIETVLYQHDRVKEAVVVPCTHPSQGNCVLHALIVADKRDGFSILGIKAFLSRQLPRYMVPERIETVDNLPKNANGKIDRKKIAEAAQSLLNAEGNR